MPDMLSTLKGRQVGVSASGDLLVRDPTTNVNHYVPRGADVSRIVRITQAAYDALGTPNATTLYLIID
jgi:hypothetical protein